MIADTMIAARMAPLVSPPSIRKQIVLTGMRKVSTFPEFSGEKMTPNIVGKMIAAASNPCIHPR